MLTYLRYALAFVCFAASVACLALWWRAKFEPYMARQLVHSSSSTTTTLELHDGILIATYHHYGFNPGGWERRAIERDGQFRDAFDKFEITLRRKGLFGEIANGIYFPLWYPALIFALAGVASLRLGRRFTLRSAIIATTVVAVLLGMVVIL